MRILGQALIALSMVLIAGWSNPLRAEPIEVTIPITSGSGGFTPDGGLGTSPLQLYGTDGFSFVGTPYFGVTAPSCCLAPGATTSFRGFWSSLDIPGTVTYNGQTFPNVGSPDSNNTLRIDFTSSPFVLPSPTGPQTMITAPFTLAGTFMGAPTTGNALPTLNATLVGSGTGTILFTLLTGFPIPLWQPREVSLQIGATDAVPEPSSILLVCLSLAGVYGATRRRRPALQ